MCNCLHISRWYRPFASNTSRTPIPRRVRTCAVIWEGYTSKLNQPRHQTMFVRQLCHSKYRLLPSFYIQCFFFFRRLPSKVATAYFQSQLGPLFCTLLRHFRHCHVLSHSIHYNRLFGLHRFLLVLPLSGFFHRPPPPLCYVPLAALTGL